MNDTLPGAGAADRPARLWGARTVKDKTTQRFFVDGFAQIRDDVVTVLTSRAIPAAELKVAAAEALEEALKRRWRPKRRRRSRRRRLAPAPSCVLPATAPRRRPDQTVGRRRPPKTMEAMKRMMNTTNKIQAISDAT
jgi:hypothetical protein